MKFVVTPEEAQRPARAVIKHLRQRKMQVRIEKAAWADAPYRTSIVAAKGDLTVLVEAQGTLGYGRPLKDLVTWIGVRRYYAEICIATTDEAILQAGVLSELKTDGVGLWIVNAKGSVSEHHKARNPALLVTPDPTLKYGACREEVRAAVEKFNEVDRKDGLRDMCEVVERLTEEVGVAACRKGWLKIPETDFRKKDWAGQVNELARAEAYNTAHQPLLSATLKDDLHSFRNARNLVGHKVRTRREDAKRQRQFAERMMQGPRLVAELVSLKRKIR